MPRYYVSDAHDNILKICCYVLMANLIGSKLSKIIKARAYLSGSLPVIQKQIEELQFRLNSKFNKLNQGLKQLKELDIKIAELSAINVEEIRPIKAMPRKMVGAHGSFRRELVRVLQTYHEPVATGVLVKHMAEKFGLPLETHKERVAVRDAVRRPLNIFKLDFPQ